MKIKHEKGTVTHCMRTGKSFVKSKMPLAYANSLMKRSKDVKESDERGYGKEICVNDKYFFPMEETVEKADAEVTE